MRRRLLAQCLLWQGGADPTLTPSASITSIASVRRHRAGSVLPRSGRCRRWLTAPVLMLNVFKMSCPCRSCRSGANGVHFDLDGVVFVERLEGTRDFLRCPWLRLRAAMKAPCCKSGCSCSHICRQQSQASWREMFSRRISRRRQRETPQALLSRLHLLYPGRRPVRRPETLQSRLCSREPERHSHGPIQDASGGQRGACPLPLARTFINGAETEKAMRS